ncbi:hypothetical protein ACFL59_14450 [Planctomycetota bacterium]
MTSARRQAVLLIALAPLLFAISGCAVTELITGPTATPLIDGFFGTQGATEITSWPPGAMVEIMGVRVGHTPLKVNLEEVRFMADAMLADQFGGVFGIASGLYAWRGLYQHTIGWSIPLLEPLPGQAELVPDILAVSRFGYQTARVSRYHYSGLVHGLEAYGPNQNRYHFRLLSPGEVPVVLAN